MDPSMLMEHIDAIGLIPLLIWQSIRMEKKLDAQAEQMAKQREDEIRSRYDRVIETYNNERDRMFRDMDRKLDDVVRFAGRRDL